MGRRHEVPLRKGHAAGHRAANSFRRTKAVTTLIITAAMAAFVLCCVMAVVALAGDPL
jgi:hypothetical protein